MANEMKENKYLISFFMLFKKVYESIWNGWKMSMNVKRQAEKCNINQITAKSNDSEKRNDEGMLLSGFDKRDNFENP